MTRTLRISAGLALAAGSLFAAGAAVAQTRPLASAMTCAEVQALVERSGAVVLNFTPTTYDRVVSGVRHCVGRQLIVPEFTPTRDTPRCFVGYTCREIDVEP